MHRDGTGTTWTQVTNRAHLNVEVDEHGDHRIVDSSGNTFAYPHAAMNLTEEWVLQVIEFMRRHGEDGGLTAL